eukprot:Rmarinus@m.26638
MDSPNEDPGEHTSKETVCYLTRSLFEKLSHTSELQTVNEVAIRNQNGRVKKIENLHLLPNLTKLDLSGQNISTMENLSTLKKLRVLNLSRNRIKRMDNLDQIRHLEELNIEENLIEHVPSLIRKLSNLRILRIGGNRIKSLRDFVTLRVLENLTILSVEGNPAADVPHARLFLIYHLRSLEVLNGSAVSEEERVRSTQRFEMEELNAARKEAREAEKAAKDLQSMLSLQEETLQNQKLALQETEEELRRVKAEYKSLETRAHVEQELLAGNSIELRRCQAELYTLRQDMELQERGLKLPTAMAQETGRTYSWTQHGDSREPLQAPLLVRNSVETLTAWSGVQELLDASTQTDPALSDTLPPQTQGFDSGHEGPYPTPSEANVITHPSVPLGDPEQPGWSSSHRGAATLELRSTEVGGFQATSLDGDDVRSSVSSVPGGTNHQQEVERQQRGQQR